MLLIKENLPAECLLTFKKPDTVEHDILLKKLYHYGVRGVVNDWIKSYLTNRTQKVNLHGVSSERLKIIHGVPQGSVLGPLLFIIYISDFHAPIHHSNVFHFADDTSLLLTGKSIKKLNAFVNHDLNMLCQWLRANKIALNASKTEIILFRSNRKVLTKHLNFRISGQKIFPKHSTKYLGVILDEHLTYELHMNSLVLKLCRAIGVQLTLDLC